MDSLQVVMLYLLTKSVTGKDATAAKSRLLLSGVQD
jgi:hypothetical protein